MTYFLESEELSPPHRQCSLLLPSWTLHLSGWHSHQVPSHSGLHVQYWKDLPLPREAVEKGWRSCLAGGCGEQTWSVGTSAIVSTFCCFILPSNVMLYFCFLYSFRSMNALLNFYDRFAIMSHVNGQVESFPVFQNSDWIKGKEERKLKVGMSDINKFKRIAFLF